MTRIAAILASAAAATLGALHARPAHACGGVFCDTGPQSMPVDQSGENILFVIDATHVEAHIQIQYEGDPAEFAWVIPLTAVPQFSVGSDALFQSLLSGTVPSYGFTTTVDDCNRPMFGGGRGKGEDSAAGGIDEGPTQPEGPMILLQQTVGAYDIVVLQGGSSTEVVEWLAANDYQQDAEAAPILDQYLQEGLLFGAIKLTAGAGLDRIHPVVLRYEGREPCVPLRLTRIAALDDMDVRTFFLGRNRVVPTNYRHVLVNPLQIDWFGLGANYKDVITAAVDAEHADGRAFVTEYAGPSSVVPRDALLDPRWNADAFRTLSILELFGVLQEQGLLTCVGGAEGCMAAHPLVEGLLAELVLPPGVSLEQLAACPDCYETTWDPHAFADAVQERIVAPGRHAVELLDTWPYVTRMYTTISPHEMTADPIFHENADLDDVPNVRMADRRIRCDNDSVFRLPDGREVYVPDGNGWPAFQDEMPSVEEVDEVPTHGAPMVLVQNTDTIDLLLAEYNAEHGWPPNGCFACRSSGERDRAAALLLVLAGAAIRRRRSRAHVAAQRGR